MGKMEKHKIIVTKVVKEIAQFGSTPFEGVETQIIIDQEHGHYLLYNSGWHNNHRNYGCYLHLQVKPDGKVWVQHDGTNLDIASELVNKGIPASDIVLEFQAPYKREFLKVAA
ncbi:MAG TPA: XisI protein [Bacteroidetes bacterium]|nr:XisI protein [Bacteroidota bacterium]